eukprot:3499115-Ditylum_brightwellii.AAC.2
MSGVQDFFHNLAILPTPINTTVALTDWVTYLPVVSISVLSAKHYCFTIAIHTALFVPGLAETLFSALDFGVPLACGFMICNGLILTQISLLHCPM